MPELAPVTRAIFVIEFPSNAINIDASGHDLSISGFYFERLNLVRRQIKVKE